MNIDRGSQKPGEAASGAGCSGADSKMNINRGSPKPGEAASGAGCGGADPKNEYEPSQSEARRGSLWRRQGLISTGRRSLTTDTIFFLASQPAK